MSVDWKAVSLGGIVAVVTMPSFLRPNLWIPAAGACLLGWMAWRVLRKPPQAEILPLPLSDEDAGRKAA